MKKSQMAIEFVILVGIGILMATLVVVVIYNMNFDRNQEKINTKMRDFTISLQNEIILASEMNEGYSRNFTLDERVENTNYNISIYQENNYTQLIIGYNERALHYRIPNVNGGIAKGNNLIRKYGGTVYISQ